MPKQLFREDIFQGYGEFEDLYPTSPNEEDGDDFWASHRYFHEIAAEEADKEWKKFEGEQRLKEQEHQRYLDKLQDAPPRSKKRKK